MLGTVGGVSHLADWFVGVSGMAAVIDRRTTLLVLKCKAKS